LPVRRLGDRVPDGQAVRWKTETVEAANGKRLRVLALDEPAAAVVALIFAEFLAGAGIFAIAERLTADGIPCPSAHDRARNPHRCGLAWSKGAVRTILTNPRYTGRQVWNRQRKDEVLMYVADVALGHQTKMRWNDAGKWIWSEEITHPPIIDADTFAQAQAILAGRGHGQCQHKPHERQRGYAFTGSLFCGECDRRIQGQWINAAPYYRCRFPAEYALANKVSHPRNVYPRQDAFDHRVNQWLATVFAPAHPDRDHRPDHGRSARPD